MNSDPPKMMEPLSLLRAKNISRITIYLCLVGYAGLLLYQIITDVPTVITTYKFEDLIPAPSIAISSPQNFTLGCTYVNVDGTNDTCPLGAIQYDEDSIPIGFSAVDPSLQFGDKGVQNLFLTMDLVDPGNFTADYQILILFYDANSTFGYGKKGFNQQHAQETISSNVYFLSPHQYHYASFKRYHNTSLVSGARNLFGVPPPNDDKEYYIDVRFEPVAPFDPTSFNHFAVITVQSASNEVCYINQMKNYTLFGMVSALGGAYSALMTVYHLLFGADPISAWGLIQKVPRINKDLREKINKAFKEGNIPIASPCNKNSDELSDSKNLVNLFGHVKYLEERYKNLEELLKEYVLDVNFLEQVAKANAQKVAKDSPDLEAQDCDAKKG